MGVVTSALCKISSLNIVTLNCCFHTKTLFNVDLACEEDAKPILKASRSYISVNYAVSSLIALRNNYERHAGTLASVVQPVLSHD